MKILRTIRQDLMEKNKTLKYLKYAIGEIFLVTVGILIAVQVNSYMTFKNDRQIEKKVFIELKHDLQKDTTDLNNLLQIKKEQWAQCHWVLDIFNNPHQKIADSAQFMNNIRKPFYFYIDNPHKTAFELAKSSGDLFKITNDSLINKISVYFTDNDATQFLATNKKFSAEYMSNVFMRNHKFNYDNFQKFKDDFLNDFEMENYYVMLITYVDVSIDLISKKRMKAIKLMEDIDNEMLHLNK